MYCQKCGTENPDTGRYCRKCGTAIAGVGAREAPFSSGSDRVSKDEGKGNWTSAMVLLFLGAGFVAVTGVLAFQPMGQGWWFWLFFPAFALLGIGVAQTIKVSKEETKRKDKNDSWESAMGTLFMGVAFLVLTLVLAFQPMGRGWWFWLFFPAFAMLGSGVAQTIRLGFEAKHQAEVQERNAERELEAKEQASLPPKQTVYASEMPDSSDVAGERVAPSVTENTTRNLEMEAEAKTRPLSKEEES